MTDRDLETWGNWLAAALGLTNPEAAGRVIAIFIPLARRLHARTGATAEQTARRVLWQSAKEGAARISRIRRLAGQPHVPDSRT